MGDLASARDRCWRRHRGLAYGRGLQRVRPFGFAAFPDSALRTGLRCGGETTTGPRLSGFSACGAPCAMTGAVTPEATSARRPSGCGRAQPALDRVTVALIGENLTEMKTRARNTWRMMTMIAENRQIYRSTAKHYSVSAVASPFCPRPKRQTHQLLLRHRSTPPDAFAHDHDRQQVSWLAGRRLGPPSQRPESLQWYLWSSAIRLQLRGQPRICTSRCAHRIPLVSPFGHYRSQTWHRTVLRVNRRSGLRSSIAFPVRKQATAVAAGPHRRSIDATQQTTDLAR